MRFEIGQSIGPYRITGVLGEGGMGSVYRVEHTITQRVEALKVTGPGAPRGAAEDLRFLREIQVQASLSHPNIASVHNAFWWHGNLVLVMELVDGEPLSSILARGRPPLDQALAWFLEVLEALRYAHGSGIIHRDVTPKNMIVTREGTLKLTDFGVARAIRDPKLTQSGAFIGSAYYAAPEQIRGAPEPDERTDLYSAGVVLYELLTGVRPYEGESAFDVMQAHIAEPGPQPAIERNREIGPELNAVVMRALEKRPESRFQSAVSFGEAIRAARRGDRFREPVVEKLRPRKRTVQLAAAVLTAIGLMAGAAAWLSRQRTAVVQPAVTVRPAVTEHEAVHPDPVPAPAGPERPSQMPPAAAPVTTAPAEIADAPKPAASKPRTRERRPPEEQPDAGRPLEEADAAAARAAQASTVPAAQEPATAAEPEAAGTETQPSEPAASVPAGGSKQRHPVIRVLRKVLPFGRKRQAAEPPQP